MPGGQHPEPDYISDNTASSKLPFRPLSDMRRKEFDLYDLSGMTLEELKVLRRDITNALLSFDSNRKRLALQEIRAVCEKYGYELKDVVGERAPVVEYSKSS
jgi:hypothetical protein